MILNLPVELRLAPERQVEAQSSMLSKRGPHAKPREGARRVRKGVGVFSIQSAPFLASNSENVSVRS
jgi:hypothetical protein